MSLIKDIKRMEELLFDIKIDITDKNIEEAFRKIDDTLDVLSKMKNDKIVLRGSITTDETYKKFRKFHGLCGGGE